MTSTPIPTEGLTRTLDATASLVAAPGTLDKVVTVPFGTVPGIVALHLRITELLVHGWDLAHATGQPATVLPADLAEQEHAFSVGKLGDLPPGQTPFAPPQLAPDDVPAIDRLAALLGRGLPGANPRRGLRRPSPSSLQSTVPGTESVAG